MHVKPRPSRRAAILIVTVPFSNQPELIMDILRYGQDVEVLALKSLKDIIRFRLQDALDKYLA
jgi:predicted DNA-binding transcriptional regulator YafY